jgi:hypothetical protein
MSFKVGGFLNTFGNSNQTSGNAVSTPPLVANKQTPEGYAGGRLQVAIKPGDTQETFVHRGFHDHARTAGLDETEATRFADKWTNKNTNLKHYAGTRSAPFTDKEFQNLKTKAHATGKTDFDLLKDYDTDVLADLNKRVDELTVVADETVAYTPPERAALMAQKAAGANQAAITEKPILTLIDGKTSDGKPIDAETALTRYIQKTYNPTTESGSRRVWGDKINEMVAQAKTDGVAVDLQFDENGTALVGVSAADKQKLDRLFHQALAKTILGEEGSLKAGKEEVGQVMDIPIMAANGVISGLNGISEPVRGILATFKVDASAGELPRIPYQSEYGKKNGRAGEIGTEIGIGILTAPLAVKTLAGQIIVGEIGAYNVAAGVEGHDPTKTDEKGDPRKMETLERGGRVFGGVAGIIGARPTFEAAGQTGKVLAQKSEVVEAVTPDGQMVRVSVPKSDVTESLSGKGSNSKEMRLPDMDEQLKMPQTKEKWRDLYGEGAETDAMNTVNKTGAGMAAKPQHHVFPREHRKFFEERGFTGERSIDKFVVTMDEASHQAIHGGADWKMARRVWKDGEWNSKVMNDLKTYEKDLGRKLTFDEVKARVEILMDKAGIPESYETWRGGVK